MSRRSDLLSYERGGEGPPLLLIHGLGGSSAVWRPVMDLLSARHDVIVPDMPGFGRSPVLAGPGGFDGSPAQTGSLLAELCESLGVPCPAIAGNSLGAWVALEMAAEGAASSVCAISPAGLWAAPLGPRAYNARRWAKRLRPLILGALATPGGRRRFLGSIFAHPERLSADDARGAFSDWVDSPGYDRANERMRALVFERASSVRVPVTIAWGARDRLVRPPRPERMPSQARYLVREGWGHTPTWDDPEGVAELILDAASATPTGVVELSTDSRG